MWLICVLCVLIPNVNNIYFLKPGSDKTKQKLYCTKCSQTVNKTIKIEIVFYQVFT